ncbi:MAG: M24 family metallopeptidase [Leptolyngbyaceae cyanobacterium SL_7_1]|nr:M24 family metallopeptidase [Leptolyngbyaceae cyanobacterium SL_7_1]
MEITCVTPAIQPPPTLPPLTDVLRIRRQRLSQQVHFPVILWSGGSPSRNFPANTYPFRASSHFLYFAGLPLLDAAIRLEAGRLELFMDDATPADRLWHGATTTRSQIAETIGADAAYPLSQLPNQIDNAATIAVQDAATRSQQMQWLNRPIAPPTQAEGIDRALVHAITQLRLSHDAYGLAEMRRAAAVTGVAHQAGMAATRTARTEAEVRAIMEQVLMAHNMTSAYNSIVTVHGEILHNTHYHHALAPGDLLLADVGAETESGWAADVTRTWAVAGKFSPSQRAIYDIVLAAHDACIAQIRPGVEYRELHLLAATTIAAGLVDLGILRGQPEELVDRDAHALFFPHGIGHLLGLDVHDMEDFGDIAGYEPGRQRSDRFGLGYLRLDRPLQPGETTEQFIAREVNENPTLSDMTQAALNVLGKDQDGFWLMVEGGDIDWSAHDNNMDNLIGTMKDFDKAVQTTINWINQNGGWRKNVLIVTADHDHYLTLNNNFPQLLAEKGAEALTFVENTPAGAGHFWGSSAEIKYGWGNHANRPVPVYYQGGPFDLSRYVGRGYNNYGVDVPGIPGLVDQSHIYQAMYQALTAPVR